MKKILLAMAFMLFCGTVYADGVFMYTMRTGNQVTTYGNIGNCSVYETTFSYSNGREVFTHSGACWQHRV